MAGLGPKHPLWKGNDVGYSALHGWVKRHLKKPKQCQFCKRVQRLDLANRSGRYERKLSDWLYLCRECHMLQDGRKPEPKLCKGCGLLMTTTMYTKYCSMACRSKYSEQQNLMCRRGHVYQDHLYIDPKGRRHCQACRASRVAEFYKNNPRGKKGQSNDLPA